MKNTSHATTFTIPDNLTLGKTVSYIETYTPDLLQGVPRSLSRDTLALGDALPFDGIDIWNGYELSWLNTKGKPCVGVLQCRIPIHSPNLIESKSFKLYLNSFNQTHFAHVDDVKDALTRDLSECAGATVEVNVYQPHEFAQLTMEEWEGEVIDDLDIEVNSYQPDASLLRTDDEQVEETLISHLLKSNCLITHQPDWASLQIRYKGNRIVHEQLLAYIISFRQHNEFHEQCVERIYCDIMQYCKPERLSVYARYTRRGGLDINPLRTNYTHTFNNARLARQ